MHIGVKNQHLRSHEEKTEKKSDTSSTIFSENKVRKSELLDDYEIDRERKEEEESGIEIQEATGKSKIKKDKIRKKWRPFLQELRQTGEVVVTRHQHHGGLRGAHIVQRMKSDLKRLDLKMELEFDIGEAESTIERKN